MKIRELKGVGPKKTETFHKAGIDTVEDLLYYFPRKYQDRHFTTPMDQLQGGQLALVQGVVTKVQKNFIPGRRRRQMLKILLGDGSGTLEAVFFNASYLAGNFTVGQKIYLYGTVTFRNGKYQMVHPEFQKDNETCGIQPVYLPPQGIGSGELKKLMEQAVVHVDSMREYIPENVLKNRNLCSIKNALKWIHFPSNFQALKTAKERILYDEMLVLQLGILSMKGRQLQGISMTGENQTFLASVSFPLTRAQQRVIEEINGNMESPKAMNRLVQGDVGSGKTVVAEAALYKAVKSGYQGALMVPSELLAKQHFAGLSKDMEKLGITVALLTGKMPAGEKRQLLEHLAAGEIDILVGTHALLQPDVVFFDLGLVVTDEQHRFGVSQRKTLADKGNTPDILVMTATPIPRTMAVVLYGELDISVIDQLPPGRKPVATKALRQQARKKAYDVMEEQLAQGRQGYVVAPLVEDSDIMDLHSAESVYKELDKKFSPTYEVGLVHGDMKQGEKDQVMNEFAAGNIDVLVATVVIEVGINVPNATVMIIENCERFGLAQLHQLRGRVGRGADQSYCLLVCGKDIGEESLERAKTMTESNDGFYIAERDLDLRGPGEIFGQRQHGIPDAHITDMLQHMDILEQCRYDARQLLEEDPLLENHQGLRHQVHRIFGKEVRVTM